MEGDFSSVLIFCKHCGLLLPAGHHTCPRCGAPAPQPVTPPFQPPLYQEQSSTQTIPPEGPRYNAAQPKERGPMGLAGYFGSLCLFAIPVVGLVFMLIWSISERVRPERRRLAQAYLIRSVIISALVLVAALLFSAYVSSMTYRMFYSPYFY